MNHRSRSRLLPSLLLLLSGCLDRQYVGPDTVALSITNQDTARERVNRCNYIPVLLGSEVEVRYTVEGDLDVVLSLTRERVLVTFEGPGDTPEPWAVDSGQFRAKAAVVTSEDPPAPYEVKLSSPCKVEDP